MFAKLLKYTFVTSIINSVVLSYLYLEAFFSESYHQSLISDFTLPFYTIPLIFLVLYLVSSIKGNPLAKDEEASIVGCIVKGLYGLMILLFIYGLCFLIYNLVKDDSETLLRTTQYVVVEILAIVFIIHQGQKEKRIKKLGFLLLLWSFTIMATYSILGFFEQYIGYSFSNDLNLIFAGVFFHLGNACFILYLRMEENFAFSVHRKAR